MKLKTRIVSTVMSMALALGVMTFAVYAAATQTLSVTNTVSFVSDHVLAHVTGQVEGEKAWDSGTVNRTYGKVTTNPTVGFNELDDWEIGHIDFFDENAPINIFIMIENYSLERMFTFELEFDTVNDPEDTNIDRDVNFFNGYHVENDLEAYIADYYNPENESIVLYKYNGKENVEKETTKILVVTLSIVDTGLSVSSFNNAFSVTLLNEGTATEQPGDGNFVYNPDLQTITIPAGQTLDYDNLSEMITDENLVFYGIYPNTNWAKEERILLPYTPTLPEEPKQVYAKFYNEYSFTEMHYVQNGADTWAINISHGDETSPWLGAGEVLVLPSEYIGQKITAIYNLNYRGTFSSTVKSIVMPKYLQEIDGAVFSALAGINQIEEIHFQVNAETQLISTSAFSSLSMIESYDLRPLKNLSYIAEFSFVNNSNIQAIYLPNTIDPLTIGIGSFTEVTVGSLTFGNNIVFEGNPFPYNTTINQFVFPQNANYILEEDMLYKANESNEKTELIAYMGEISWQDGDYNFTDVTLPNTLTKIHPYALYGIQAESLTIPASVNELYNLSFPGYLDELIFEDNSQIVNLASLILNGEDEAEYTFSRIKKVTFGSGSLIETIGENFFAISGGAANPLYEINLEALTNLKVIEAWAFSNTRLTQITLPQGLETIGEGAFANSPLFSIVIPSSVTRIEQWSFSSTLLVQIRNLSSATQIDDYGDVTADPIDAAYLNDIIDWLPEYAIGYEYITNTEDNFVNTLSTVNGYTYFTINTLTAELNGTYLMGMNFETEVVDLSSETFEFVYPSAFAYNHTFKTIKLPSTVKSLGAGAFLNTSLKNLILASNNVVTGVFSPGGYSVYGNVNVYVPANLIESYQNEWTYYIHGFSGEFFDINTFVE